MTTFAPPLKRHRRNRDEPLQPCSVSDCPDPLGGPTLTPDGLPHRFRLERIGGEGVACGPCYDRVRKRYKRLVIAPTIKRCVIPGCSDPDGKLDFSGRRPGRFDLAKLGTGLTGWSCQSCFSRLLHAERKQQAEANGREDLPLDMSNTALPELKERIEEHAGTMPVKPVHGRRAKPKPVKTGYDSPLWGCRVAAAFDRRDWDRAVGTATWEEEEE